MTALPAEVGERISVRKSRPPQRAKAILAAVTWNPIVAKELRTRMRGWHAFASLTAYTCVIGTLGRLVYNSDISSSGGAIGFERHRCRRLPGARRRRSWLPSLHHPRARRPGDQRRARTPDPRPLARDTLALFHDRCWQAPGRVCSTSSCSWLLRASRFSALPSSSEVSASQRWWERSFSHCWERSRLGPSLCSPPYRCASRRFDRGLVPGDARFGRRAGSRRLRVHTAFNQPAQNGPAPFAVVGEHDLGHRGCPQPRSGGPPRCWTRSDRGVVTPFFGSGIAVPVSMVCGPGGQYALI